MPYQRPSLKGMDVARRDTQSESYRRVIDGLIKHREAVGMTQWDVADRMGIDQSQISKLERRERRFDIVDYVRYCRAVGLDPGSLLGEIRDK